MACGEDGPHVRPQRVDRALEVLQSRRDRRGARKPSVDVIEQTAERCQLLGERLVRHTGISIEEGECPEDNSPPVAESGRRLLSFSLHIARPDAVSSRRQELVRQMQFLSSRLHVIGKQWIGHKTVGGDTALAPISRSLLGFFPPASELKQNLC